VAGIGWSPRPSAVEHLPAGCGFGLLFSLVTGWTTVNAVDRYREACGAAGLFLIAGDLPLLVVGHTAVFALVYTVLRRRDPQAWPAFAGALLAMVVLALAVGAVLVVANGVPDELCRAG
jgi:uncharacterized BrkB/YihY/UPF0761 family membrane protein